MLDGEEGGDVGQARQRSLGGDLVFVDPLRQVESTGGAVGEPGIGEALKDLVVLRLGKSRQSMATAHTPRFD